MRHLADARQRGSMSLSTRMAPREIDPPTNLTEGVARCR